MLLLKTRNRLRDANKKRYPTEAPLSQSERGENSHPTPVPIPSQREY